MGEPAFKVKQINEWIWQKGITDFDKMTNLSVPFRNKLKERFDTNALTLFEKKEDTDGAAKFIFTLSDGLYVESVLIPSVYRTTACISTQVGCSLGCTFCATGSIGFYRNLFFWEMFDQVAALNRESEEKHHKRLENIVFMGMGEPLMNYVQLIKAIEKITSPQGLGFSPQRITVSTAGLPSMIRKLANDKHKFNLAVSLNSANQTKRNSIMPINMKFKLEDLQKSLQYYYEKIKNIITLEYIVLEGFNDSREDVKEIQLFTKGLHVKFNLIEYNTVQYGSFKKTSTESMTRFKSMLEDAGYIVNIRKSKGRKIQAACGQLAARYIK